LSHPTIAEWFNTAAFTVPASNCYVNGVAEQCFGTAGRNTIIGPGLASLDMALSKNFPIGDSKSLELRVSATNVLNLVRYQGIDTVVSSPTYGRVTSIAPMRKLSLSGRYRF
jgi:hypothetical protein